MSPPALISMGIIAPHLSNHHHSSRLWCLFDEQQQEQEQASPPHLLLPPTACPRCLPATPANSQPEAKQTKQHRSTHILSHWRPPHTPLHDRLPYHQHHQHHHHYCHRHRSAPPSHQSNNAGVDYLQQAPPPAGYVKHLHTLSLLQALALRASVPRLASAFRAAHTVGVTSQRPAEHSPAVTTAS